MELIITKNVNRIDFEKLLDVYEESNRENMTRASDSIREPGDFLVKEKCIKFIEIILSLI